MRIKSIIQIMHWFFLVVGALSIVILMVSANTYLHYARENYGLEVSVQDAYLDRLDRLVLNLRIHNPGGMDVQLDDGNITINNFYEVSMTRYWLNDGDTMPLIICLVLKEDDLGQIKASGHVDLTVNINIYIHDRYAHVNLHYQVESQEVRL